MANEYLKETPTSTGNRKVWTWARMDKKKFKFLVIVFFFLQEVKQITGEVY